MPNGRAGDLFINLSATLVAFIAGVLFAEPIKRWVERRRQLGILRKRKVTAVRIFPILFSPWPLDQLKHLLVQQNGLQKLFRLEVINWQTWSGHEAAEARLHALRTDSRLEFAEAFQAEMECYSRPVDANAENFVNLAITDLPFPKNFYCWNTRNRQGIVIGIGSLRTLFREDPVMVNKIVLRVVQRMSLFALGINELKAHEATRGCLFDLTPLLTDLQFSVDKTFLCTECERVIAEDRGTDFKNAVAFWVEGRKLQPRQSA